jgi:hypothetical protein
MNASPKYVVNSYIGFQTEKGGKNDADLKKF